jgi:hypothetical protein
MKKAPITSRPGYVIKQTTIAAVTSLAQGLNATTNAYLLFVLSLQCKYVGFFEYYQYFFLFFCLKKKSRSETGNRQQAI